MIEIIKKIIQENTELNYLQKNVAINMLESQANEIKEQKQLYDIVRTALNKKVNNFDIIFHRENEYIIYKTYKHNDPEDLVKKYPYRFITYNNETNKWESNNTLYPTLDVCFLALLEKRHLKKSDTGFIDFVIRMLNMNVDW